MQKQLPAKKEVVVDYIWQADDKSLVLSCPSSQGGTYLVGITIRGNKYLVAHECPAIIQGYNMCRHVNRAVAIYRAWRRDNSLPFNSEVRSIPKKIILRQNWRQIPVPEKKLIRGC